MTARLIATTATTTTTPPPGRSCGITDATDTCSSPVDAEAPLNLCVDHLLAAHEWVTREVGVTDTLPMPCAACGSRLGVRYPSGWLCAICEWRVGEVPDHEEPAPRVDVVYYLRFRDRIKIGTSANPRRRFASLRYDEVLAFERGDRQLEQRRHAQFAEFRIHTSEWFDANAALAEHIRVLREGTADPWSQHRLWLSQELALHR